MRDMSRSSVLASLGAAVLVTALAAAPTRVSAQQWPWNINYASLTDLHQQSRVGPSVTVDSNNLVYLAWSGTNGPSNGTATQNIAYSSDGINFSAPVNPLSSTDWAISTTAPAITVFGGNIYYAWTGGSNHINIAYAPIGTNLAGAFTSHKSTVNIGGAVQTATGSPALTVNNGALYLAWSGGGNQLNLASSVNGTTWSKTTYSYTSTYSPGVTAVAGNVYLGWVANNKCFYINASTGAGPYICSGTQPNPNYTYSPVLNLTGPGMTTRANATIVFAFGALPYVPGNLLFVNGVAPGVNAPFSYTVQNPPGYTITGNPALLVFPAASTNTLVYFTDTNSNSGGTEIKVAQFTSVIP